MGEGVAVQELQQLPLQFLLSQTAAGVQDRLLRPVHIGALEQLAGQAVIPLQLLHRQRQHIVAGQQVIQIPAQQLIGRLLVLEVFFRRVEGRSGDHAGQFPPGDPWCASPPVPPQTSGWPPGGRQQ